MDEQRLLKPGEVDLLMRYPRGRCARLAREGRLPHIKLPDGEIRFLESDVQKILQEGRKGPSQKQHRPD